MRVCANETMGSLYSRIILAPEKTCELPEILPGQFIQIDVPGSKTTYLRRPISINDVDYENNTISLLVRKAGDGTKALCSVPEGEIINVLLPLGNGFPLDVQGKSVLLIGGGVGVAPLLYYGKYLKKAGVSIKFVLGARTAQDLLMLNEFKSIADVEVATEDGSQGTRGFVTGCKAITEESNEIWAVCGPMPMMKAVASIAKERGVDCFVSLENKMACGLGACLCCVENTVSGHQCVCTSGPVFNTAELLW